MKAREARRHATRRLAHAARQLCAEVGSDWHRDGLSDADRRRMVDAFNALSHELDVRTGDAVRVKRTAPVDPLQEVLFETTEGDGDRG